MHIINPYRYAGGGAFSPDDLANLTAWYDADDISTLWTTSARSTQVASLNDPVGAWDDKSGNAYHLLQTSAGARPTYKTTAGIYFDGASTQYVFDSTARDSVNLDGSYFFVYNHASGTSGSGFTNSSNANAIYYGGVDGRHPTVGVYAYMRTRTSGLGYVEDIQTFADFDDGANHVASFQLDTTDAEVWNDGSTQGTDTDWIGDVRNLNRICIGALIRSTISGYITAHVMEAIYYDVVLSDTDRQSVESYLTTKWSI